MTLALGVLVLAVTGLVLFLSWPHATKAPEQVAVVPETNTARYVVPEDLADYVTQMDAYTSIGGKNPAPTWTFDTREVPAPTGSTTLVYAVETAANQIKTGGGPARVEVTHFKVINGTAYILLNIDEDGWAGASFAINKIHPLVERTLLLDPSIKKVVFGLPKELKAENALQ